MCMSLLSESRSCHVYVRSDRWHVYMSAAGRRAPETVDGCWTLGRAEPFTYNSSLGFSNSQLHSLRIRSLGLIEQFRSTGPSERAVESRLLIITCIERRGRPHGKDPA
jgi:hypothetical protein